MKQNETERIQPLDQSKNIRCIIGLDDTDLRASLEKSGWLPQFPAYADENGVLIVGHRRMKIATQLGIKPIVETIHFGNGSEGEAKRLELAIASNIGAGLSRKDRESIAVRAYAHGYTMEQIGKLLGVVKSTVSKDLAGIVSDGNNSKPAKTATNPKGAGRPRSSPKPPSTNEKSPNAALNKEKLAQDFNIGLFDGIRVKLELSEKEFKLLNRALSPQSAPNEIDKALVAFGRSYRTRHSSIQRYLGPGYSIGREARDGSGM